MDVPFEYTFPALRGVQARREYYVSMCPLRLIPKIFIFDEEDLTPEVRAQRVLNKSRLPEISRYVLTNRNEYTFSALTASIDAEVRFEPLTTGREGHRVGLLRIPMTARFVINDGQHRRAAIEMALQADPSLGDESIAVVFFLDVGLQRCQQMFADLNRYAVRTTRSLGVLYDHRDEIALLAKKVVFSSPLLRDLVEIERSTLSNRSRRLFTLSALYGATSSLLSECRDLPTEQKERLAADFWAEVAGQFPAWHQVHEHKLTAAEIRRDYIHSHGVVLQAIGRMGAALFKRGGNWRAALKGIRTLDWSRSNAKLWEGRAMIGGRVSKALQNVVLTTNAIKLHLRLPLTAEEQRVETAFQRGRRTNG